MTEHLGLSGTVSELVTDVITPASVARRVSSGFIFSTLCCVFGTDRCSNVPTCIVGLSVEASNE